MPASPAETAATPRPCGATDGPYTCNRGEGLGHPGQHGQLGWLYDGSYDNHWWTEGEEADA